MVRLNLLLDNHADARSGYLNLSAKPGEGITQCAVDKLEAVVDCNEVSELVAYDILDTVPTEQADALLTHWLSRLAHGGELTISVVDVGEVARDFLHNKLDINQFNSLIHGETICPRRCALSLNYLCAVLENKGMIVLKKRVHNYRAIVSCRRP
jgi:hypothetical protein